MLFLKHNASSNDLSPLSTEQLNLINGLLSLNHSKLRKENQIKTPISLVSATNPFLYHLIRHNIAGKIIQCLFDRIMTTNLTTVTLTVIILSYIPIFCLTIRATLVGSSMIPYLLLLLGTFQKLRI